MTLATLCFPYMEIGFILLGLYVYGSMSINLLILSSISSALLIAVPSFWVIFKEIGAKFSFYGARNLISDIKVGFPIVINIIFDFILAAIDRFFIALYLTVADVGSYSPGYALGSLIVFLPKAMGTALPQLLCRAVDSGNGVEARKMLNYAIKIYLILAIPFIAGCLVLGKPILGLLANHDVAEKAFWVAPIVALGTLFYGLNIILSNVLFVSLKTYVMFRVNALAALSNVLANLILLYFYRNIVIAAITTFVSYFIAFVYLLIIVRSEWTVGFEWPIIAKCVCASLLMGGVLMWVASAFEGHSVIGTLAGELVLGVLVYGAALFSFRTFSRKEISYAKSVLCGWRTGKA